MPIDPITGAIISAGISSVSQAASGLFGNKARRKAATKSYERNLANWHRQNAYNDPSMQMQRLKGAGLNPNMVYGTGVQAAGQASSQPSAPTATQQNIQLPDAMAAYTSMEQLGIMKAQRLNIEADTRLKESGTELKTGQSFKLAMSNTIQALLQNEKGVYMTTESGRQLSGKEMFDALMDGTVRNPAVLARYKELLNTTTKREILQSQSQLEAFKSKLAKVGLTTNDPLAIRLGTLMALDEGADLSTIRGLAIAADLIGNVAQYLGGRGIAKALGKSKMGGKLNTPQRTSTYETFQGGRSKRTIYKPRN